MAKKRVSIKDAEVHSALERSFERKARNFAFETGQQLEVRDTEVFLLRDGQPELLCVVEDPRHFWRITWQAMAAQFPALKHYLF
jgi:hypothetical protein